MNISTRHVALLLSIPLLFLLAFFVVPFGIMVFDSFRTSDGFGLDQYVKIFKDWYYAGVIFTTFRIAVWVTLASFVIGYPLAYFMTRVIAKRWQRRIMYVIVITPLFTSNIVRSFGWMILLGRRGMINESLIGIGIIDSPLALLNNELSIVIGMTYIMTPFMVLTVASVLQNVDRNLEHAACDLGANPLTSFLKITFPLSIPGIVAGSLIVFTLTVSAYVTPNILSGGKITVMSMLIYQNYAVNFDFEFGAALAVALLIATLMLISASKFFGRMAKSY